jgi:hypothetical protein
MNIFTVLFYQTFTKYRCRHNEFFHNKHAVEVVNNFRSPLSSEKLPMRVLFDFNTIDKGIDKDQCTKVGEYKQNGFGTAMCDEEDILKPEKERVLKETFANIEKYINRLLNVTRLNGPIDVRSRWGLPIDQRLVYDRDLVVTVFIRPYGDESILAAAAGTAFDSETGRSVQGIIYINLKETPDEPEDISSQTRFFFDTCLHELIHVLGLASDQFSRWINPITGTRYGTVPIKEVTLSEYPGKVFRLLQTPNAINVSRRRYNREFFKDSIPMGIEMEEKGGQGTEGSHVKGRTYYNDAMVGIAMTPAKVSEITLSILEDMGWYECDWSLAEPLPWGDGESLGKEKLYSFPSDPPDYFPEHYLCKPEENNERVCNYDFSGVSFCRSPYYIDDCPTSEKDMGDVCKALNYYDKNGSHWFGPSDCHDFMRILVPRDHLLCARPWEKHNQSGVANANFMTFGKESMCSPIIGKNINGIIVREAGCYNMECVDNGLILETTRGNVTCTKKGQRISVDYITIICPDPGLICPMKKFAKQKVSKPTSWVSVPTASPTSPVYVPTVSPTGDVQNNDSESNNSISESAIITIYVSAAVIGVAISIIIIVLVRNKFAKTYTVQTNEKEEVADELLVISP